METKNSCSRNPFAVRCWPRVNQLIQNPDDLQDLLSHLQRDLQACKSVVGVRACLEIAWAALDELERDRTVRTLEQWQNTQDMKVACRGKQLYQRCQWGLCLHDSEGHLVCRP